MDTLAAKRDLHAKIELSIGLWTFVAIVALLAPGAQPKHVWYTLTQGNAYRSCMEQLEGSGPYELLDIRAEENTEQREWLFFFDIRRPGPAGGKPSRQTFFCSSDGQTATSG